MCVCVCVCLNIFYATFFVLNPTSKKYLEVKAFFLATLEVEMFYDNWNIVWGIS